MNKKPPLTPKLLEGVRDLWRCGELIDVTLKAEGQEFPCHRLALASNSAYFRAMFKNDLSEKVKQVIPLPTVEASSLASIIEYMYLEQININSDNAQSIFTTASLFAMPELQSLCSKFMVKELHISNCLAMYQFASFHNDEELEEEARKYCIDRFRELRDEEELMYLDCQDFVKLLQSNELNVKCEEEVAEIIVKWLETDITKRKPTTELLLCLRLPLLSKSFIRKVLCSNQILMANSEYCSALTSRLQGEEYEEEDMESLQRHGMFARKMLVFVSGGLMDGQASVASYDPETGKNYWSLPMHAGFDNVFKMDFHRIALTKRNEMFLSGGTLYQQYICCNAHTLSKFYYFNPHRVGWDRLPNMLDGRCAHGFVSIDRNLYIMGGKGRYPKGSAMSSMHCYNIDNATWQECAPMPLALYHFSAIGYGRKILVLGGISTDPLPEEQDGNRDILLPQKDDVEEYVSRVCFEYDIDTDCWSRFQANHGRMNMPRYQFGVTICNDKLYAIAGCNGQYKLSTMEVYDFKLKKWCYETEFPEDRCAVNALTMNNCVYVCGGERTIVSRQDHSPRVVETKDLWKFDPDTRQWTRETKLVQHANIHACVVADMNLKKLKPSELQRPARGSTGSDSGS